MPLRAFSVLPTGPDKVVPNRNNQTNDNAQNAHSDDPLTKLRSVSLRRPSRDSITLFVGYLEAGLGTGTSGDSLLSTSARLGLRASRQFMMALSLGDPILPDLIKQSLIADLQQGGRLLAVPVRLFEGFIDSFSFGFILGVAG